MSEVGDRVGELIKKWPDVWGSCDQNGIVIVVPYSDQVCAAVEDNKIIRHWLLSV